MICSSNDCWLRSTIMAVVAMFALLSSSTSAAGPKYLMFYDFDPATQANWTNMGFTRSADQIVAGYALGFRSLFIVDTFFFYDNPANNHLTLLPNYLQLWESAWSTTIQNLAENYGCIGVFIGDELLLGGLTVESLTIAADTVRATWPNAIIYWNEAWKVIVTGVNNFGEAVNLKAMPTAFDWISMDYYKLDSRAWSVPPVYYREYMYPRMSANQSALVVPGSYGSNMNRKFSFQQYEDLMFENAWEYYQWALTDPRIIGINPWYYGPPGCGLPGYEVSTYEMAPVLAMWQKIGRAIVTQQPLTIKPTADSDFS